MVGVGGGMIRPMQSRWEQWLARAQAEVATTPSATPPPDAPWERTSLPGTDTPTGRGFPAALNLGAAPTRARSELDRAVS